ncbi:MAG: glycosyltransferase [Chlorobiaceae bacterium]|nr:glycosyltransferase [Chlorobiaceae bacterium]NTW74097.1 glycosyltransferase [Chlorobiaceae bacterium]
MTNTTIAYLCSEYPAISHTFIFREIESLRKAGISVHTASIRKPSNVEVMTPAEQKEAEQTLMVLSRPLPDIVGAHLDCLMKNPAGYLKMAALALGLMARGPKSPVKAAAYFVEAGVLLQWLRRHGVTHVHEHFANPTAIVAMLMKRYGGITYSISVHGPDIFYTVDTALLAEKIDEASFVRCISHYCRSQVMRISDPSVWDKHHIVRCGVDPELYTVREEPANTVVNLLCVGRLVPAKGQHLLIEACRRLRDEGFRFMLTIVGEGPDKESLRRQVSAGNLGDFVTFTGVLGQDKVRECYDRADMFILASFAEGVPVVLMEAMAKEIPVISTRITGIPELIDHGQDGLLATPGDVADLADQIRRMLVDPGLRRELGKAGRRKVLDRYDLHRNNLEMADLFTRQEPMR